MFRHFQASVVDEKKRLSREWVTHLTDVPYEGHLNKSRLGSAANTVLCAVAGVYAYEHEDSDAQTAIQNAIDPLQAGNAEQVEITMHHLSDIKRILGLQALSENALKELHDHLKSQEQAQGA